MFVEPLSIYDTLQTWKRPRMTPFLPTHSIASQRASSEDNLKTWETHRTELREITLMDMMDQHRWMQNHHRIFLYLVDFLRHLFQCQWDALSLIYRLDILLR